MKRILVGLALTTTLGLAVPAMASADIGDELDASGAVERKLTRTYRGYDFVASCDQTGRTKFWCDWIGDKGSCYLNGHASVRGGGWSWRVRLRSASRSCF